MSTYRSLAASLERPPNSSHSSSSKAGAGSSKEASTRPTSRETTGANDIRRTGAGGDRGQGEAEERLRKRRAPGTVSGRACNECRQSKQKCDGEKASLNQPQHLCSRCEQRNLKCVIEENTKTQKDSLIEQLRIAENFNKELQSSVIDLESKVRDLNESNDWRGQILNTMGTNVHVSAIIQRLRDGQSSRQIAQWLHREVPELRSLAGCSHNSLSEVVKKFEVDCRHAPVDNLMLPIQPWTDVSSDICMISCLLDLYFSYVHPVHLLFCESDFKRSFQVNDSIHCSGPLVNSICAMACFLYENKSVNDGHVVDLHTTMHIATLRKGFLDEAKRTLQTSNLRLLTSVQSCAIMYLIELSSGKGSTAVGYLDAAIDGLNGLHESPQSHESKVLTYWGLRNLKTFCSASTYRTISFPFLEHQPDFDVIDLNGDDETWQRYSRPGYNMIPKRPTFSVLTAYHQAKLFQVMEDNIIMYRGRPRSVTAEAACNQLRRYSRWQQQLAPKLNDVTNVNEEEPPLPHFIYLHVQYYTAIVQHLVPILLSGALQGEDLHSLRDIVVSQSWKGLEFLQMAQHMYTTRFCLPLISFCTVYLGDALLVNSPHLHYGPSDEGPSRVLRFCLVLLQQTRAGFPICGPLQKRLHDRAIECGVPIPDDMGDLLDSFAHYDTDSFLDAFTRLCYAQPIERIHSHIDPAIAEEWQAAWTTSHRTEPVVKIADLLNSNDLFNSNDLLNTD